MLVLGGVWRPKCFSGVWRHQCSKMYDGSNAVQKYIHVFFQSVFSKVYFPKVYFAYKLCEFIWIGNDPPLKLFRKFIGFGSPRRPLESPLTFYATNGNICSNSAELTFGMKSFGVWRYRIGINPKELPLQSSSRFCLDLRS